MLLARRSGSLALVLTLGLAPSFPAQTVRLTGDLARGNLHRGTFGLTPDGVHVIFAGHYSTDTGGVNDLYCAPSDGRAEPVRLYDSTYPPDEGREFDPGRVAFLALTGDSQRVVFSVEEREQLFVVPPDGSAAPLALAEADSFRPFLVSADGLWAVFTNTGQGYPWYPSLRSVPTDGSGPALELVPPDSAHVLEFAIEPGSRRVVLTLGDGDDVVGVFSVPIDGSAPAVRLSPAHLRGYLGTPPDGEPASLPGPRGPDAFRIAPDGEHVLFLVHDTPEASSAARLLVAPTDGHEPVRVLASGDVRLATFTPDSTRVVHRTAPAGGGLAELRVQDLVGGAPLVLHPSADAVERLVLLGQSALFVDLPPGAGQRLYAVPLDGSTPPQPLSQRLPVGRTVREFQASPDGAHLVYSADARTPGVFTLFLADLDRKGDPSWGQPDPRPLAGDASVERLVFTPDSAAVLVRVAGEGGPHLERVPLDGGAVRRLSGPEGVSDVLLDASGTVAAYRGAREHDTRLHVYSVSLVEDTPSRQLDDFGPVLGGIQDFQLHPNGELAVYAAGGRDYAYSEFYRVPLDASEPPRLLDGLLIGEEYLIRQHVDGPSDRLLYITQSYDAPDLAWNLFSARLDGQGGRVALSPPGSRPLDFRVSGERVIQLTTPSPVSEHSRLLSGPIDGSSPAVLLNDATSVAGARTSFFELTRDGQRVVYVATQNAVNRREIFSVPVDGSQPPVQLNPPVGGGRMVYYAVAPRLTADGTRVVFAGDLTTDEGFGLWVAPVDGSAPALELWSPPRNREVKLIELTPDSRQAVFTADLDGGAHRLHVVPLDGSSAPVALPTLPGAGEVYEFRLDPRGTRVVYMTAAGLASVPVDGSAGAVLLSTLPGRLFGFQVSPEWVAYLADHEVTDRFDLYVVPLDGSAPPRRVNSPVVGRSPAIEFRIVNEAVFFTAPTQASTYPYSMNLFKAPLSGALPPYRLTPPGTQLAFTHGIGPFFVSDDGHQVLFRGFQDDLQSLFVTRLRPRSHEATTPTRFVER